MLLTQDLIGCSIRIEYDLVSLKLICELKSKENKQHKTVSWWEISGIGKGFKFRESRDYSGYGQDLRGPCLVQFSSIDRAQFMGTQKL